MALLVATLFVLGVSLGGAYLAVSTKYLMTERNQSDTTAKLRALTAAISRTNAGTLAFQDQRSYEQDVGALPTSLSDLLTRPVAVPACALDPVTHTLKHWCGPYWTQIYQSENPFADGWGTTIVYDSIGRTLTSYGANRASGGGDDLVQAF